MCPLESSSPCELRLANEVGKVVPTSLCVHFPSPTDSVLKYLFKEVKLFWKGHAMRCLRTMRAVRRIKHRGSSLCHRGGRIPYTSDRAGSSICFCISLLSAKMLRAASRWPDTVWRTERHIPLSAELFSSFPQKFAVDWLPSPPCIRRVPFRFLAMRLHVFYIFRSLLLDRTCTRK